MTQTATVRKLIGDKAEIEVQRMSACAHNCAECGGGCSELTRTGPVIALAQNPLGARTGDRVLVESSSKQVLGFAAVVYLLPIGLFFLGFFLAAALGAGQGPAAAVGAVCFLLSLGMMIVVDRRARKRSRDMFTIVGIL